MRTGPPPRQCACSSCPDLLFNSYWESERKRRALPRLRLDPNPAAVHLNDALRYGKSQSSAALLAGDGIIGLLKLNNLA
jgi:hypothetical protein